MEQSIEAYIIGSVRTNNFNDEKIFEKISTLWKIAHSLGLENPTFYGIYHHYETDYKGDYDLTVASNIPVPNHETITLPKGHYNVFPVNTSVENGILHTWEKIWSLDLKRTYDVDFEKYHPDGTIEIFISIEPD